MQSNTYDAKDDTEVEEWNEVPLESTGPPICLYRPVGCIRQRVAPKGRVERMAMQEQTLTYARNLAQKINSAGEALESRKWWCLNPETDTWHAEGGGAGMAKACASISSQNPGTGSLDEPEVECRRISNYGARNHGQFTVLIGPLQVRRPITTHGDTGKVAWALRNSSTTPWPGQSRDTAQRETQQRIRAAENTMARCLILWS